MSRKDENSFLPICKCLLILCFTSRTMVPGVKADIERHCSTLTYLRGAHPQGICGPNLADTIELTCGGMENVSILRNKKSAPKKRLSFSKVHRRKYIPETVAKPNITDLAAKWSKLGLRFLKRKLATSYLNKRSTFYDEGVACECCYHSCSYEELKQYCIVPPSFPF